MEDDTELLGLRGRPRRADPRRAPPAAHRLEPGRAAARPPAVVHLRDGAPAYFVHSFAGRPTTPDVVVAETTHGGRFASIVASGRLLGTQFHPERSGVDGLSPPGRFRGAGGHGSSRTPAWPPDAAAARHPVPRRRRRPGGQRHTIRGPARPGRPGRAGRRYAAEGADELVFLDIDAAPEARGTLLAAIRRTSHRLFVPLTVGGGVRTAGEMRAVLRAGADKVAFNTAAVSDVELIRRCAWRFGRQCVVVAIDARARAGPGWIQAGWEVVVRGGRTATGSTSSSGPGAPWSAAPGELLLTSIDRDGTRAGFDLELLRAVTSAVDVPVIASGGAGGVADMVAAITEGGADAVLAASIFHQGLVSIAEVKNALAAAGVPVRHTERAA